jgi:diguanylate cyclase (GGDEF)-like protein
MFILVLLFSIQKYKNNKFYFALNIGFYLLFLSYFVDAIDQIFIHSIVFTVIFEKSTLVFAAIFIYLGCKQWMKAYEEVSLTDYLTQIPNRKLISQMVNFEISKCIEQDSVLSIAIIDIDYFKKINDEFGHSAGDAILKSFAKFLSKSINKNFNIGRWGGEEFIVLMKHTNIDQAKGIMDEIRINTSKQNFSHENITQKFTISIGLSQWHDNSDDFESLFIKADKALYRAKKAGRNTVEY